MAVPGRNEDVGPGSRRIDFEVMNLTSNKWTLKIIGHEGIGVLDPWALLRSLLLEDGVGAPDHDCPYSQPPHVRTMAPCTYASSQLWSDKQDKASFDCTIGLENSGSLLNFGSSFEVLGPETPQAARWLKKSLHSTIQSLLTALSQASIPGVGPVASLLLDAIKRLESIRNSEFGWNVLIQRYTRLGSLVQAINKCTHEELKQDLSHCYNALLVHLRTLASDLNHASKQGRVKCFLNAADIASTIHQHEKTLDGIVNDMTATLCTSYAIGRVSVEARMEAVLAKLEDKLDKNHRQSGPPCTRALFPAYDAVDGISKEISVLRTDVAQTGSTFPAPCFVPKTRHSL